MRIEFVRAVAQRTIELPGGQVSDKTDDDRSNPAKYTIDLPNDL